MKEKRNRLIEEIIHSHRRSDLAIAAEYISCLKDESEIFRLLELRSSFLIDEQLPQFQDQIFLAIERVLFKRESPMLNIALSLFGNDNDIIKELFLNSSDSLKSACLKNRRASIVFDDTDYADQSGWLTISFLESEINSFDFNQLFSLYSNPFISFDTLAYLINPESIIAKTIGLSELMHYLPLLDGAFGRLKSNLDDPLNFEVFGKAEKIKQSLSALLEAISNCPENLIGSNHIFELAYDSGLKIDLQSYEQLLNKIYSLGISEHDKKQRRIGVYIHAKGNVSDIHSQDPASRYAFLRVADSLDYKTFEKRMGCITLDSNMYDAILENHRLWDSTEKREWIASNAPRLDDTYSFKGALSRMRLKHPRYFSSSERSEI